MALLDLIVDEIRENKVKLITRDVIFMRRRSRKEFHRISHYALHEGRDEKRLSKKTYAQYLEVMKENGII